MLRCINGMATHVTQLQLKSKKKEMVIKALQCSLRKIAKNEKMLENKSRYMVLAGMDGGYSKVGELRKMNNALNVKIEAKYRKLRQYKLLLTDIVACE